MPLRRLLGRILEEDVLTRHRQKEEGSSPNPQLWGSLASGGTLGDWKGDGQVIGPFLLLLPSPGTLPSAEHGADLWPPAPPALVSEVPVPSHDRSTVDKLQFLTPWGSPSVLEEGDEPLAASPGQFWFRAEMCIVFPVLELLRSRSVSLTVGLVMLQLHCVWWMISGDIDCFLCWLECPIIILQEQYDLVSLTLFLQICCSFPEMPFTQVLVSVRFPSRSNLTMVSAEMPSCHSFDRVGCVSSEFPHCMWETAGLSVSSLRYILHHDQNSFSPIIPTV